MKVLRFVLRSIGGLWSALMILLMVMSLSLSVAMTMVPAVFATVSGVVGTAANAVGFKRPTVAKLLSDKEKVLTAESERLKRQSASMADREKLLTSERDKLNRQLASPEVEYRGKKMPVGKAVSDTSTRIANRVKFAARRNVAFTAGEALPFVGVVTIAAATAWELADACRLLEDMRKLDAAFNEGNAIDPEEICGMTPPSAEEIWASIKSTPSDAWDGMTETLDRLSELDLADLPDWASVEVGLKELSASVGSALNSVSGAVTDGAAYVVQMGREGIGDGMESARGLVEPFFGETDVQSDQSP